MVSEHAVSNLLINCVDNLHVVEDMFEFVEERYAAVLDDRTTRDRVEVCRCLNAANAYRGMARQCYNNGDTVRAKGYMESAFNSLERVRYLH